MYRNFICYRGGSSAGILFADDVFKAAKRHEDVLGKTYYSLVREDTGEIRNFLNDPQRYLGETSNFIMLLTKGFFDGFLLHDLPNPDSVTRVEIEQALKNPTLKFIPVVFPDFSWDEQVDGQSSKDILTRLYGEESMRRIVGSPPIQFVFDYREQVVDKILSEIDPSGTLGKRKNAETVDAPRPFRLESTPSVIPKSIFCGREEILAKIKEYFSSGERVIFLQGIGGIGKTEIAKQYAKRNKSQYDTIIYATYNGSIPELIISQSNFKIDPQFPPRVNDDGSQESELSYYRRKLELIQNITNERTLIIIDNFDVMNDEHFSELLEGKYHLLLTTRCDYSRLYPAIKIEPLESMEQLRRVFLDNYQGYMVEEDDEHLDELINMVNRHTYTIELIAQHMENSGQTTQEMIEVLRQEGIVSLNEEVRSSSDKSSAAYQNLLKMFKVFNLSDEEKTLLQHLALCPLTGVDPKDLRNWLGVGALRLVKGLENRSWVITGTAGIALHPIIADVVRYELPLSEEKAKPFLDAFAETIKEEKSWHFPIDVKAYYADIALRILDAFPKISDVTIKFYKNAELLFSFSVKPEKAVALCTDLYQHYAKEKGTVCYECAYYAFQAGWTYLFNLQLKDSAQKAREWFELSYGVFVQIELHGADEYAAYGHLLSHLCRLYVLTYEGTKDPKSLEKAFDFGRQCVANAEAHLNADSPYYSRLAVAYMQLSEVYVASEEYDKALPLLEESYRIVVSLFGEDDPDALNVSSRKSRVLYHLGRYEEAVAIGQRNIEAYTRFNGEINFLRFEQMALVMMCFKKQRQAEAFFAMKESILRIGASLLGEDSPHLKQLQKLTLDD